MRDPSFSQAPNEFNTSGCWLDSRAGVSDERPAPPAHLEVRREAELALGLILGERARHALERRPAKAGKVVVQVQDAAFLKHRLDEAENRLSRFVQVAINTGKSDPVFFLNEACLERGRQRVL